ncbi:hypothetical protein VTO42DRAFT_3185 [Malbranchea cinnamomea]
MSVEVRGPVPTQQVFLYQIPQIPPGSKIRFLGCVSNYDASRGVITFEHNYTNAQTRRGNQATSSVNAVEVDVNLLLESLTHTEVQIGAWLNVFGYVREQVSPGFCPSSTSRGHIKANQVYVEAIMIIPAGAIRLGEYERVLQDAQEADRRVNRPST